MYCKLSVEKIVFVCLNQTVWKNRTTNHLILHFLQYTQLSFLLCSISTSISVYLFPIIHSSVRPSRLLTVSTKQQELHTNNCPITNLGMAQSDSQDPNWSYFGQHFRTEHRKKTNNLSVGFDALTQMLNLIFHDVL